MSIKESDFRILCLVNKWGSSIRDRECETLLYSRLQRMAAHGEYTARELAVAIYASTDINACSDSAGEIELKLLERAEEKA